jgi:hypothetical protein
MQVAKPLTVFGIWKIGVGPVMDQLVPQCVFIIISDCVGQQRSDDCLVMRPPDKADYFNNRWRLLCWTCEPLPVSSTGSGLKETCLIKASLNCCDLIHQ